MILLIRRHPLAAFLLSTFALSWGGAFALVAPRLLHGERLEQTDGLLMFPVMLVGPVASSIVLTAVIGGRAGLGQLGARLGRVRVAPRWYAAALIAPVLALAVLFALSTVSVDFRPRLFPLGGLFGLIAGLLEEIGWSGFALPLLLPRFGVAGAGVRLGLVWGLWHLPVIDYLGSAYAHGTYLLPYFASFVVVLTGMRVLMTRVFSSAGSVPVSQLMHASLTGSLAAFGPVLTAAPETLWYGAYGVVLVVVAGAVLAANHALISRTAAASAAQSPHY